MKERLHDRKNCEHKEGFKQLASSGKSAIRKAISGRGGIKLQDGLTDGTGRTLLGKFEPGDDFITLNRAAIRNQADDLAQNWRTQLRQTTYHESFHRSLDRILTKHVRSVTGTDPYTSSSTWHATEEGLAEIYGIVRGALRSWTGI